MKSKKMNNRLREFKNKKSALFTLDSIFAIVFAGIIIMSIIFTLRSIGIGRWVEGNIISTEMDILTIMEKNGMLNLAVQTNDATEIKLILNSYTRENLCFIVKIYDSTSKLIATDSKTGCTVSYTKYTTKRSFIYDDRFYYATLEGWYNEN
jgi:hypothetical protein